MTCHNRIYAIKASAVLCFLAACASTPKTSDQRPDQLQTRLMAACEQGKNHHMAKGALWVKIRSGKEELQFPATVKVEKNELNLEVTNLIGGREATIHIQGESFEIRSDTRPSMNQKGKGSWNQIPVSWALKGFLGQPPCFADGSPKFYSAGSKEGQIVFSLAGDRWVYDLETSAGKERITRLVRESAGAGQNLEIVFERPDPATGAPWAFRAVSLDGELKVRWKDRELH